MKTLYLLSLLVALSLAQNATDYNGKCVSCVLANSTFYYCTKSNLCVSTFVENQSCEQGLTTCLNYKSVDLGLKEITPFSNIRASFNYTVKEGQGVRFGISNQDSKVKGWFKVMLKTSSGEEGGSESAQDTTEVIDIKNDILSEVPAGVKLYYFD